MDKEQLRIAWIDVMKGFLFTLVVLGHFLTTLPTPEFLRVNLELCYCHI